MSRARWWEVSGVFDGWKIIKHTIKASTPDMARKKVRAKYRRGALAGFPLEVRETSGPRPIHPCGCTIYNGGQCFNCLNGAHDLCADSCDTERAKTPGVVVTFSALAGVSRD